MAKKQHVSSSSGSLWVLAVAAVLAVSVGLGAFLMSRPSSKPTVAQRMEMPNTVPPMPDWLKGALQPVKEAYIFAASHHDELQYIPCYCGCGGNHPSNSACYFRRDQKATVTAYDQHAYG